MVKVRRVRLNNTSRKGLYYRVSEKGKTRYYKAGKSVKRTANRTAALEKFRAINPQSAKERKEQTILEKAGEDATEEARLHLRLDYNASKQGGRRDHQFTLRDSFISARIPKGMSDSEAQTKLLEIFADAFKQEFGADLWNASDFDMVSGLERGQREPLNKVVFQYKHGSPQGGAGYRRIEKGVEAVETSKAQKEAFFRRLKR